MPQSPMTPFPPKIITALLTYTRKIDTDWDSLREILKEHISELQSVTKRSTDILAMVNEFRDAVNTVDRETLSRESGLASIVSMKHKTISDFLPSSWKSEEMLESFSSLVKVLGKLHPPFGAKHRQTVISESIASIWKSFEQCQSECERLDGILQSLNELAQSRKGDNVDEHLQQMGRHRGQQGAKRVNISKDQSAIDRLRKLQKGDVDALLEDSEDE